MSCILLLSCTASHFLFIIKSKNKRAETTNIIQYHLKKKKMENDSCFVWRKTGYSLLFHTRDKRRTIYFVSVFVDCCFPKIVTRYIYRRFQSVMTKMVRVTLKTSQRLSDSKTGLEHWGDEWGFRKIQAYCFQSHLSSNLCSKNEVFYCSFVNCQERIWD
jgi:hypothetical protein